MDRKRRLVGGRDEHGSSWLGRDEVQVWCMAIRTHKGKADERQFLPCGEGEPRGNPKKYRTPVDNDCGGVLAGGGATTSRRHDEILPTPKIPDQTLFQTHKQPYGERGFQRCRLEYACKLRRVPHLEELGAAEDRVAKLHVHLLLPWLGSASVVDGCPALTMIHS